MKILLVITKAEIGGAQVFVLNLARGLKKRGLDVLVACGPGSYLPNELEKENIACYRFKTLKRGFNPIANILFIKELRDYVMKNNFDVVHLNSTNALLGVWGLRKLDTVKKVFTVHGLSLIDKEHKGVSIVKNIFKLFFKQAFKYLDKIVFVSKLNLDYAFDSKLIEKKDIVKAKLIYNGLDLIDDYFLDKEIAREELGLDSNSFIYGSIGRLAYPKNYEFLIENHLELKKEINDAKLVIIGQGPERVKYEGLIKTYGLDKDVVLLGEKKDASKYLKAFDLFVLPSVFEGLSISLIEAVMANTKTIASKVGGNEEIIGSDSCYPLDNKEEYLKLVKEKVNNQKIENNNKEKFRADIMVDKYIDVYGIG
ncbi:MAG: glycosyltransferase [Patescibacteria group bacterium]|jgi:glycosyltransferase involved in cell wall biosynthesis|nr:glycosyltransferase [Patescibacteria group bacterium]